MNTNTWRRLLAGAYAWVAAVSTGAVMLDMAYARLLSSAADPSLTAAVFPEAADLLLFISAVTVLAGIGAIAASWEVNIPRNLFIASLVLTLLPLLLYPLLATIQANLDFSIGLGIRLTANVLSSILAVMGSSSFWDTYSMDR